MWQQGYSRALAPLLMNWNGLKQFAAGYIVPGTTQQAVNATSEVKLQPFFSRSSMQHLRVEGHAPHAEVGPAWTSCF